MTQYTAHLIATSNADDAAFEALVDLSEIIADEEGAVIIGGHMVELITAAFPAPGLVSRRTQDADAGIPTALASSGQMHAALLARGYSAAEGNRYVKGDHAPQPTIDLLVPTTRARFGQVVLGGRGFNEMPGLGVGASPTFTVRAELTLQYGTTTVAIAKVPHLEGAVILKSIAWRDRHHNQSKDGVDLGNLFAVLQHHRESEIAETWQLRKPGLIGFRRDAAAILHDLADLWDARPPGGAVDSRALVSRIRTWVTDPR
ncbi:hypothetical protein ACQUSY_09485 [Microbacterium sp. YY-03]|uniref:hypothetical protein n=1 Tax=Microbacterium sp. YY-03 TaxID=3421636 RepID=UPI003D178AF0